MHVTGNLGLWVWLEVFISPEDGGTRFLGEVSTVYQMQGVTSRKAAILSQMKQA